MSEIQETMFLRLKKEQSLACSFTPPKSGRSKTALGTCDLHGHRLALYREATGSITGAYAPPGTPIRKAEQRMRTGETTLEGVFRFANTFLVAKALRALRGEDVRTDFSGVTESTATIRDAFDRIRGTLESKFTTKQWREILRILALLEQVWELDKRYIDLDTSDIQAYITHRTELGMRLPAGFSRRPTLRPCKLVTAVNDLLMLATLCKRIQGDRVPDAGMIFRTNPFAWLLLPEAKKALREKPTAARYEILLPYADRVDPTGRLRLSLSLARWHGRRIGSIAALTRANLRLRTKEMLVTLREIARVGHQEQDGIQGTDLAYAFTEGAVDYEAEHDKQNYHRLVPMSTILRSETDNYLRRNPDLTSGGPLFPSDDDPTEPISVPALIALLHEAEKLARSEGHEQEVPELYDSAFHGYRGLRATELEDRGHRSAHVNFIVGWSCKVGDVKETRYVTHSGTLLFAAVEGLRPYETDEEHRADMRRMQEENERLRSRNEELLRTLSDVNAQNVILMRQVERLGAQLDRLEERFVGSAEG